MSRFFTPEFFLDPYPTYDELRSDPVHWEEELHGWVLTSYGEVAAALADPRVSRGGGPREGDLLLAQRSVLPTQLGGAQPRRREGPAPAVTTDESEGLPGLGHRVMEPTANTRSRRRCSRPKNAEARWPFGARASTPQRSHADAVAGNQDARSARRRRCATVLSHFRQNATRACVDRQRARLPVRECEQCASRRSAWRARRGLYDPDMNLRCTRSEPSKPRLVRPHPHGAHETSS